MSTEPEQPTTSRIRAARLRLGDVVYVGRRDLRTVSTHPVVYSGVGHGDRVRFTDREGREVSFPVKQRVTVTARREPCVGCGKTILASANVPPSDVRCMACGYDYLTANLRRTG